MRLKVPVNELPITCLTALLGSGTSHVKSHMSCNCSLLGSFSALLMHHLLMHEANTTVSATCFDLAATST
jgi:hypothetical protein